MATGAPGGAGADEVVPFNTVRKRTAVGLLASKSTLAHALAVVATDYSSVDDARHGERLTALPFVARAVVDALREFPLMNATTNDDGASVVTHRAVHLGIAVDLDFQGLVVPVVRDADGLRLRARRRDPRLGRPRARARKLGPDDLAGGTFTITNPGASGTWISFPVINRPQVGILATDGVSKQVVADADGRLGIAPIGHLCCVRPPRARRRVRGRVPRPSARDRRDPRLDYGTLIVSRAGSSTSVGLQPGGAVTGSQRAGVPPGIFVVYPLPSLGSGFS